MVGCGRKRFPEEGETNKNLNRLFYLKKGRDVAPGIALKRRN